MNENTPVEGANVVSSKNIDDLRTGAKEAAMCCDSFGKGLSVGETRGKAIGELVSLIERKTDVAKCSANLGKLSESAKKVNMVGDVSWLESYNGTVLEALGTPTSIVVK